MTAELALLRRHLAVCGVGVDVPGMLSAAYEAFAGTHSVRLRAQLAEERPWTAKARNSTGMMAAATV